jgi:hypothetical protein
MSVGERRTVRSVDVRSVVRVSFALSLAVSAVVLVGLVALFLLGLVSGGLGGVEGFIASLGFTGFQFSILPFTGVFIIAAALASAVVAIIAGLLASLYNALGPIVGGVEVTTKDR